MGKNNVSLQELAEKARQREEEKQVTKRQKETLKFANKARGDFRNIFCRTPDSVEPVDTDSAIIKADNLEFEVKSHYWHGIRAIDYTLKGKCPKCDRILYIEVIGLKALGEILHSLTDVNLAKYSYHINRNEFVARHIAECSVPHARST